MELLEGIGASANFLLRDFDGVHGNFDAELPQADFDVKRPQRPFRVQIHRDGDDASTQQRHPIRDRFRTVAILLVDEDVGVFREILLRRVDGHAGQEEFRSGGYGVFHRHDLSSSAVIVRVLEEDHFDRPNRESRFDDFVDVGVRIFFRLHHHHCMTTFTHTGGINAIKSVQGASLL